MFQAVAPFQVIVQVVEQFQYVCVGVFGYIQGHRRVAAKGDDRGPLLAGPDQFGELAERHHPRCGNDREVPHDCRVRAGALQAHDPGAVGCLQVARGGIAKIGAHSLCNIHGRNAQSFQPFGNKPDVQFRVGQPGHADAIHALEPLQVFFYAVGLPSQVFIIAGAGYHHYGAGE